VLILLYTGVATPTEVGALGAFLSAVIGFAMGRLTLAGALEALKQTLRTTAMIFMILIGATLLGYYITQSQVPQRVVMAITEMSLNRWVVIGGIIVGYFIVSMFMDEIPLMIITLQLAFPLVVSLGFDPIWFGVITILMVAMGLVFPPVGLIAFIVSATTKVDVVKVYKGTSIMTIAIAITAVLIMIFPELALWLPSMMRG
jgi:TRAP-type C4-dicarboxylate transport system permease large subunit